MKVNRALLSVVLSGMLAIPVFAQDTSGAQSEKKSTTQTGTDMGKTGGREDRMFMQKAAIGGMMEVELGKLAQEKAASEDVKNFGKRMVDDHGKANEELQSLASSKGVTLPTELPAKEKAMMEKLRGLSGAEFDREYMRHMVADHNKDVAEFRKASRRGSEDVRAWAGKTLTTLEDHLKQAKDINAKVGGGKASAAQKSGKKKAGMAESTANP